MSSPSYASQERSYHGVDDAVYVLPNDSTEHERLEEQAAHLSAIMNHKVVHSPLDSTTPGLRILDIGCGTGTVTCDLGTRFKDAQVFGLDLSPVPTLRDRPANVQFLKGNALTQKPSEWIAQDNTFPLTQNTKFDLVFGRLLICGLTDWPGFIRSVYQLLKPGGHIEIQDLDWKWYGKSNEVISDSWSWWPDMKAGAARRKIDFDCGTACQQRLKDAGFLDIHVQEYRWSWSGPWEQTPEQQAIGNYSSRAMPPLFWDTIAKMMSDTDASDEQVKAMRTAMLKDFEPQDGKHWKFYVNTGRKPA